MAYYEQPEFMPPISELGSDALFEPMQLRDFIDSLGQKKTGIKALLLDQVEVNKLLFSHNGSKGVHHQLTHLDYMRY
jgi:formamidopyrimidine-DNA glycosylase